MTLIDRVGMMIEGSMFGDSAKEYHDLIKVNGIYRMSRGQIREDNFNQNQSQDEKISKYTIRLKFLDRLTEWQTGRKTDL